MVNPPPAPNHEAYMRAAIRIAEDGSRTGRGGPFGCVIVRRGQIVGQGSNEVTSTNDPTAHAEVVAIRRACAALGSFKLDDCVLYASCEPCPMCLAAIHWSHIPEVYFGNTRQDAAAIGFDDQKIASEICGDEKSVKMKPLLREEAQKAFREWKAHPERQRY